MVYFRFFSTRIQGRPKRFLSGEAAAGVGVKALACLTRSNVASYADVLLVRHTNGRSCYENTMIGRFRLAKTN